MVFSNLTVHEYNEVLDLLENNRELLDGPIKHHASENSIGILAYAKNAFSSRIIEDRFKSDDTVIVINHDKLPIEPEHESKKNDKLDNKPDFSLLHLEFPEIEEVVRIYEAGERKYGRDTWESLEDGENRYWSALCRHHNAHMRGEILDPEDGCYHIAKVIWNAIAMAHSYFINNPRPQDK
ncbi:MAG: DUF5664 domain-containing protein [Paludibacteraceae bacterium]|nr:DUF5664 domain-containing protein [Paludibacteraceae bacterium]